VVNVNGVALRNRAKKTRVGRPHRVLSSARCHVRAVIVTRYRPVHLFSHERAPSPIAVRVENDTKTARF
jgi:hypothetical protein